MPTNINSTNFHTYIRDRTVEIIPWRNSFLYLTMNPNEDYDDYSALDAATHLSHVLHNFFEQKRNAYTYALAKRHFDDTLRDENFATAARLFKIITGTNLVTNKHVLHYRTAQGMRYLIKKQYAQSSQRDTRTARRANIKDNIALQVPTSPSSTPSPFVQLMASKFDDSSSDDDSTGLSQKSKTEPTPHTHGAEETKQDHPPTVPTETYDDETPSVHSDLTKHAEALEKDMDTAMADLDDPEYSPDSNQSTNITQIIQQAVQNATAHLIEKLQIVEQRMTNLTTKYESLQSQYTESVDRITTLQHDYERLNRQTNFVSRAIETIEPRVSSIEHQQKDFSIVIDSKIESHLKPHIQDFKDNINNSNSTQQLNLRQDKLQRRLTRLKEGTKSMFQQTESDYDLLTDRLHRLETDFKNLNSSMPKCSVQKKLSYINSSDSDSSNYSKPAFTKHHHKFDHHSPENTYRDTNYY